MFKFNYFFSGGYFRVQKGGISDKCFGDGFYSDLSLQGQIFGAKGFNCSDNFACEGHSREMEFPKIPT